MSGDGNGWYFVERSNTNTHFIAIIHGYKVSVDDFSYKEYNDLIILKKGLKSDLVYIKKGLSFGYENIDYDSFEFEENKKEFISVTFKTGEWQRIAHNIYKTDAYYARTRTYGPLVCRVTSMEDTGERHTGW